YNLMQAVLLQPSNTLPASTQEISEEKSALPELDRYLDSIAWDTAKLTPQELQIILAAACMRFLVGIADLNFVLGLVQKIKRKYREKLTLPLWYGIEALEHITYKMKNNTLHPTDSKVIADLVNDAQQCITKKNLNFLY